MTISQHLEDTMAGVEGAEHAYQHDLTVRMLIEMLDEQWQAVLEATASVGGGWVCERVADEYVRLMLHRYVQIAQEGAQQHAAALKALETLHPWAGSVSALPEPLEER